MSDKIFLARGTADVLHTLGHDGRRGIALPAAAGVADVAGRLVEGADPARLGGGSPDESPFQRRSVTERDIGDIRTRVVPGRVGADGIYASPRADEGEHLLEGRGRLPAFDAAATRRPLGYVRGLPVVDVRTRGAQHLVAGQVLE